METDLLENLPPPAISASMSGSWPGSIGSIGSMLNYMNFPDDGPEEHVQQYGVKRQQESNGPRPRSFGSEHSRAVPLESHVRTGIGSSEWFSNEEDGCQRRNYYIPASISTFNHGEPETPSPTSTTSNYQVYSALDDSHSSASSPTGDHSGLATPPQNIRVDADATRLPVIYIPDISAATFGSAGVPIYSAGPQYHPEASPFHSTSHTPFHSESHSPLSPSLYSSPLVESAAASPSMPSAALEEAIPYIPTATTAAQVLEHSSVSPFREVLQDEQSAQFVNMSDVYSPSHSDLESDSVVPQHLSHYDPQHDTMQLHYTAIYPPSSLSSFTQKSFPRYSPPLPQTTLPSRPVDEDVENEFGYCSPFGDLDDTALDSTAGIKRSRMDAGFDEGDSTIVMGTAKRARTSGDSGTKKGRGRPKKSRLAIVKSEDYDDVLGGGGSTSVEEGGFAYDSGDEEEDADSDVYVPSDGSNYGGSSRRRKGSGVGGKRKGMGDLRSGNAEALRELERKVKESGAGLDEDESFRLGMVMGYSGDDDSDVPGGGLEQQEYKIRRRSTTRTQPVPVPNLTKKSRGRKVPITTGTDAIDTAAYGSSTVHDRDEASSAAGGYNLRTRRSSLYGDLTSDSSVDMGGVQRGRPTRTQYHRDAGEEDDGGYGLMLGMGLYGGQEQESASEFKLPANIVGPTETYKRVSGGIKKSSGERRYVCTADGCGKCFVRGEHLKRHVRSLHTWEKRE
ncbi:hypothetical protein Moror_11160 [Moniliophthora roreri MCA 2997]|uniref:C2H2-type domain-containing protein n=2 Tax=Moniliophthora roreri TaxID=221103 RepID=V2W7B2_MONRO|nr:hypothetical protein Moror_11160 [Moniliophthora roreri MCA 2997]